MSTTTPLAWWVRRFLEKKWMVFYIKNLPQFVIRDPQTFLTKDGIGTKRKKKESLGRIRKESCLKPWRTTSSQSWQYWARGIKSLTWYRIVCYAHKSHDLISAPLPWNWRERNPSLDYKLTVCLLEPNGSSRIHPPFRKNKTLENIIQKQYSKSLYEF